MQRDRFGSATFWCVLTISTGTRTNRIKQLEYALASEMDPLSKFFSFPFYYLNIKIRKRIMQNDKEKKE